MKVEARQVLARALAAARRVTKLPVLSPGNFVVWAVAITVAYAIMHLAGLREYTSVISGTSPTGKAIGTPALLLGVLYAMAHLGFVLAAPVLLIAAGVFHGLERALGRFGRRHVDPAAGR